MEKLIVYGGSFNPPHNGHLNCILAVQQFIKPDLLLLVPTGVPPHKTNAHFAGQRDRLKMLEILTKQLHQVSVDTIEIESHKVSYTVDTLQYLKEKYQPKEMFVLVGEDMFLSFHQWKNYKEILKIAAILVVKRSLYNDKQIQEQTQMLTKFGGNIIFLNLHPLDISSTQIRDNIKSDISISKLVPKEIELYINQNKLYK